MTEEFLADNDELLDLIHANMRQVEFQHYNLEIYFAIAQLFRQNLYMLRDLEEIDKALKSAEGLAGQADAKGAIASLDYALDLAERIRQQRNETFPGRRHDLVQELVSARVRGERPGVPRQSR